MSELEMTGNSDDIKTCKFENRVLRRIFSPRREKVAGGGRKGCKMRSFVTCTFHQILVGSWEDEMGGACSRHRIDEESMQNFY
jgi:hypothetical protein